MDSQITFSNELRTPFGQIGKLCVCNGKGNEVFTILSIDADNVTLLNANNNIQQPVKLESITIVKNSMTKLKRVLTLEVESEFIHRVRNPEGGYVEVADYKSKE